MKFEEHVAQEDAQPNRKTNNQAGNRNQAEAALNAVHKRFERHGLGMIHKTSPPGTIKGKRGGRAIVRLGRANFVDYIGAVKRGEIAQAITMEAKSKLGGESWRLENIKKHQQLYLINHAKLGAISCLHITRRAQQLKTKSHPHSRWCIPLDAKGQPCRGAFSWADTSVSFERLTKVGFEIPASLSWTDAIVSWDGKQWRWNKYQEGGWESLTDATLPTWRASH